MLDHALKMMEKYSSSLENTITDRTRQLVEETKKADIILYKFLPRYVSLCTVYNNNCWKVLFCRPIADRLKLGYSVEPEVYESVTVMFSCISEFTAISDKSSPLQLCSLLNDIYYQLDEILDEYDVYKVQTIFFVFDIG